MKIKNTILMALCISIYPTIYAKSTSSKIGAAIIGTGAVVAASAAGTYIGNKLSEPSKENTKKPTETNSSNCNNDKNEFKKGRRFFVLCELINTDGGCRYKDGFGYRRLKIKDFVAENGFKTIYGMESTGGSRGYGEVIKIYVEP